MPFIERYPSNVVAPFGAGRRNVRIAGEYLWRVMIPYNPLAIAECDPFATLIGAAREPGRYDLVAYPISISLFCFPKPKWIEPSSGRELVVNAPLF